ncbi:LysM peptidoglycan-binding domain-containing protein [Actinomadura sp. 6N118]|uniref:LysM peptidoglycan-binding domain-containing protein n=1 Tax=Actinomadura sp. 6N118 TaxID=3375151 RepID=UPI0037A3B8D4
MKEIQWARLGLVLFSLVFSGAAAVTTAAPATAIAVPGVAEDVKYYVVAEPRDGQEPEFLFDIARRTLRNGDRAKEIFELNKGRPQPGGGRMTDPATIRPGWILRLPADALGPGVRVGPLPRPGQRAPAAPAAPAAGEPRSGGLGGFGVTTPALAAGGLVGIVFFVGGITFLRAKKRATAEPENDWRPEEQEFTGLEYEAPEYEAPEYEAPKTVHPGNADESFWGPETEEPEEKKRRFLRRRHKRGDDFDDEEDVTGFWPPELGQEEEPPIPKPTPAPPAPPAPSAPMTPAAPMTPVGPVAPHVPDMPPAPPGFGPFAGPPAASAPTVSPPVAGPPAASPPNPVASPVATGPRTHEYEVGFGDDLVILAVDGDQSATAWRPLPHDVPNGQVVVCVGAAPRGCLFLDLANAPGTIGIRGPVDAACRLAEALVYQLSTDIVHASVALVGNVLPDVVEGPRVRRVPGLSALAVGNDETDLVVAVLPEGRHADELVPSGGPRIITLRLGGTGDGWRLTIVPGRGSRAWSTPDLEGAHA